MTTKEQVLNILNSNPGVFFSGQEIADRIYVTRTAVWKSIKALEKDGHQIEAVTNKGYRLKKSVDLINTESIKKGISKTWKHTSVFYYDEIDSTNDEIKRLASSSNKNIIVIANKQLNGHGRRGREFYSPENTGLYFSILIHTNNMDLSTAGITAVAACATAKAIDDTIFNGEDTMKIKWVNDIYHNNKKVAGILSEACNYMEDESSNYIIIGFGINLYEPEIGFPKNIKKTAGSIIPSSLSDNFINSQIKNNLVIEIVNNLILFNNNKNTCLKMYRNKSTLIGNYVKINSFAGKTDNKNYAKVIGINSKYHLLIEYDNGTKDELSSGEVSVVKY